MCADDKAGEVPVKSICGNSYWKLTMDCFAFGSLLCNGTMSGDVQLMKGLVQISVMLGHVRGVLWSSWSSSQGLSHGANIGGNVPTAQPNQLDAQLFHGACEFLYFAARTLPGYQVVWKSFLTLREKLEQIKAKRCYKQESL